MKGVYVIPALDAARHISTLVSDLRTSDGSQHPIIVVDDGSQDQTADLARRSGAQVLLHPHNRGKGAALQTALEWARQEGFEVVTTLDADGQHPVEEAVRLMNHSTDKRHLVLGVRDLAAAGAPKPNQFSNAFSNLVLSLFGGKQLHDTQCGLRRYPVTETLALGAKASGYAFEADVILRAARRGMPIAHIPTAVYYPPESERVSHFRNIRDPAQIVARVVGTTLTVPHHRFRRRLFARVVQASVALALLLAVVHQIVRTVGRMPAPAVTTSTEEARTSGGVRHLGRSFALRRHDIWEVTLRGTPEQIGWAHAQLLRPQMIRNEGVLFSALERYVPSSALRALLLDTAVWSYRNVDQGMSAARLREIAAQARGFQPDPFERFFPTYQRFVYLNALYDISLSFEYSPLIGCTTFTVAGDRSATGSPLLGRAFDFEVDDVFDREKAVFFVEEAGKIPFVSVAWPGLVGVVSGMNAEGVAVVVHGARAGPTEPQGEPVVHALRRVLSEATSTDEAIARLAEGDKMVSHLVVLNDAQGHAVAVERVVGRPDFVRELAPVSTVTNHLEGPAAQDPKNQRVRQTTSTLARRARGDVLTEQAPALVSVEELLSWLRDRRDEEGNLLPAGDRRAIDALIATHGVLMSTRDRLLWVSRGPHLLGEFIQYDLSTRFRQQASPDPASVLPRLPPDPQFDELQAR